MNHSKRNESYESILGATWITPPVGKDTCPYTGLKHGKFYAEFCGNPEIHQLRTGTGKNRGKRVFYLPDIHDYLMRRAKRQMGRVA